MTQTKIKDGEEEFLLECKQTSSQVGSHPTEIIGYLYKNINGAIIPAGTVWQFVREENKVEEKKQ